MGIDIQGLQMLNFQPHPSIAAAWQEMLAARQDLRRIKSEADTYSEVKKHESRRQESDILNKSQASYLMKSEIAKAAANLAKDAKFTA